MVYSLMKYRDVKAGDGFIWLNTYGIINYTTWKNYAFFESDMPFIFRL